MPGGTSLEVTITYAPQQAGLDTALLVVDSNDAVLSHLELPLTAATLGSIGPRVEEPGLIDLGLVEVGRSRGRSVELGNTGNRPLHVHGAMLTAGHFRASEDTLVIEPGAKAPFRLTFAPEQQGPSVDTLLLYSNDPLQPLVKVPMRGLGEVFPAEPVTFDFDLAAGDQDQRVIGEAVPGKIYQLQLHLHQAPSINGWSTTLEYDPTQVRYVDGSFQVGDFISGLIALVNAQSGRVDIGGAVLGSDAHNAGDGHLGSVSFEVQTGFTDSVDLAVTALSFRRLDRYEDNRVIQTTATLVKGRVGGLLAEDFDGSGMVDFADFFLFAEGFGGHDPRYDLDGSGTVDFADFFRFVEKFSQEDRSKLIALAQEHLGLPATLRLDGNYPNPFNGGTVIRFALPTREVVNLSIFNLAGQQAAVLVDGPQLAGLYSVHWNGLDDHGRVLASGLYLYRLQAGSQVQTRKLMLVR